MAYSKLFSYQQPDNAVVAVLELSCSKEETINSKEVVFLGNDMVWQLGKFDDHQKASMSMTVFVKKFMDEIWHLEESKTVRDMLKNISKQFADKVEIRKAIRFEAE